MEETTQPVAPAGQQPGKNKKVILIVVGVVVLLAVGSSISNRFSRRIIPSLIPGVPAIEQKSDGSMTYSKDGSTVTVGGGSMPANWPSDAPAMYSGGTIVYSGTNNPSTGAEGSAVIYSAKAPVAVVSEYYTAGLKSSGWTIESTANVAGMTVLTAKKDTRTIAVYFSEVDGATQVTSAIEFGK